MTRIISNGLALQFGGKTVSMPPVYDDWFLPCQESLIYMKQNLYDIGGQGNFESSFYWSSTESLSTTAGAYTIDTGSGQSRAKN